MNINDVMFIDSWIFRKELFLFFLAMEWMGQVSLNHLPCKCYDCTAHITSCRRLVTSLIHLLTETNFILNFNML